MILTWTSHGCCSLGLLRWRTLHGQRNHVLTPQNDEAKRTLLLALGPPFLPLQCAELLGITLYQTHSP